MDVTAIAMCGPVAAVARTASRNLMLPGGG
jgi:hypothetical protein